MLLNRHAASTDADTPNAIDTYRYTYQGGGRMEIKRKKYLTPPP